MATPPALVDAEWVHAHLDDASVRIVDGTKYPAARDISEETLYNQRHIPGAVFFNLAECCDKSSPYANMLPSAEQFGNHVGQLGISNETHVVIYDDNGPQPGMFSPWRIWWMFRVYGHDNVSVMDGGLAQWLARGHATTAEKPSVVKTEFKATFRPALIKCYEDVKENIERQGFTLADARPNTAAGTIPGAINVPLGSLLNEQKCMKTPDELKQLLSDKGIPLDRPLAVHCGAGMSACAVVFAAFLCGKTDAALYDGSWDEWSKRTTSS